MTKHFLPYGKQSINKEDIQAVSSALQGEIITRGKYVEAFEAALAQQCQVKFAVAFNSGTAALQACYFAAQTTPYDVVYTTPNSFFSTAGAALAYKAPIVFVDIDRKNGNICLESLAININQPRSRGKEIIVPVHFAGIPVNIRAIDQMIKNPDTVIIEDAAHALGSFYEDGSPVGSCQWSQMTIFSFHPVKNITTGEGGAVTTNDPDIFHLLKRFRNNGIERDPAYLEETPGPWHYEVHADTGNYNFTDMQAALGISQLKRLQQFVNKRRQLVKYYRTFLKNFKHVHMFSDECDERTAFHLFVIQINFEKIRKTRAQVMDLLMKKGIGTQVHYIPIYRHPRFSKEVGDIAQYFPQTEKYFATALSLPLFYDMEESDVARVVNALKEVGVV